MNTVRLLANRNKTARKAPFEEILRGSLIIVNRFCGKDNCRCRKGQKHKSLYLCQYYKGGPRMIYIPKSAQEDARRFVSNYRKLKAILDKVSDANIRLLTRPKEKNR